MPLDRTTIKARIQHASTQPVVCTLPNGKNDDDGQPIYIHCLNYSLPNEQITGIESGRDKYTSCPCFFFHKKN